MDKIKLINEEGQIVIDSNIMLHGQEASAGSKMLESYIAPYSSHIVEKLEQEAKNILGIGQINEFGLGQASSQSVQVIAGEKAEVGVGAIIGSSYLNLLASKGLNGFLASNGTISRYGIVSVSSSFTRPLIFGGFQKILEIFNIIGGHDPRDPMSINTDMDLEFIDMDIDKLSFGIYGGSEKDLDSFSNKNQVILDHGQYIRSVFDVILSVEVAGSTARFDGIRYGYVTDSYEDMDELYAKTRAEAFDTDTKKAIVKGNIYAGHSYERNAYENAIRMRRVLVEEVDRILDAYDFIIASVDSDLAILASLANKPLALVGDMLILAGRYQDEKLLTLGKIIEEEL